MVKKIAILFLAFVALLTAARFSAQTGGQIIRLDPALDALVSPDSHIEKLKDGFGFLEGPVWVHTTKPGYLLFSDIPANVIDKWTPDGQVATFLDKRDRKSVV